MLLKVAKVLREGALWWKVDVVEQTTYEDVEKVGEDLSSKIDEEFTGRVEWSEEDVTFYIKSRDLDGECIDADITGFFKEFARKNEIHFRLDSIITDATDGAIYALRF